MLKDCKLLLTTYEPIECNNARTQLYYPSLDWMCHRQTFVQYLSFRQKHPKPQSNLLTGFLSVQVEQSKQPAVTFKKNKNDQGIKTALVPYG